MAVALLETPTTQTGLRIGEVAEHLGMHEKNHSTLRLWIATFGQYLSPSGRGGGGRERRFTDTDLGTLSLVRRLRAEGHNFEAIAEVLDRQVGRQDGGRGKGWSGDSSDSDRLAQLEQEVRRLAALLQRSESERSRLESDLAKARTETATLLGQLAAATRLASVTQSIIEAPVENGRGLLPADLGLVIDETTPVTPCPECHDSTVMAGWSPAGRRFLVCSACSWARPAGTRNNRSTARA